MKTVGAAGIIAFSLLAYGQVRSQTTQAVSKWLPVFSTTSEGHIQSGMTGILKVEKPAGRAAFNVMFPTAFKAPPNVVLTVVGDPDVIVSARLTALPTATGFSGVASTPFFPVHFATSSVTVQWIAFGE